MFRTLTATFLALALSAAAIQESFAFALGGPVAGESYQTPTIGYGLNSDVLSPRTLNQEYRWNTPILYYAFDESFLNYFGSNGVAAVDAAFAVMNNLTNVSSYSPGLTEFPLNSSRFNFRAQALNLLDLKSFTLQLILEQLGLAPADRWTWCLRLRTVGSSCPANVTYIVIQRNIDPLTSFYSSYVDGTQYGYIIDEVCNPPNPLADAVEYPVDPTANTYVPVASQNFQIGLFFGGLTRDDVGGLRYMLTQKAVNFEAVSTNSLLISPTPPTSIVTSNLAALQQAAAVSSPAQLLALFPTLQITSSNLVGSSNIITTNVTTVITSVTNPPPAQSPAGTPPTIVSVTNTVSTLTTNFQPVFAFTFGNVTSPLIYFDGGILKTNFAEFIFTPTNSCGFTILSNLGGVLMTNTNTSPVSFFTNHTLAVELPNCVANASGLYQGIEKMNFFRKDFDSLLGQAWTPITNTYQLTFVTNGAPFVRTFSRVVTAPDILFTAADTAENPTLGSRTTPVFVKSATAPAAAGGPGIIQPQVTITLNTAFPMFDNGTGSFLNDFSQTAEVSWGSFDGTTNAPVVYPSTASLSNLDNELYLQFTVAGPLATGHINAPYTALLTATGAASPPYNWTVDPSQGGGLPPGLSLGFLNGKITGTPTATGVFDFYVIVSDSVGRAVERNFSIEIDP